MITSPRVQGQKGYSALEFGLQNLDPVNAPPPSPKKTSSSRRTEKLSITTEICDAVDFAPLKKFLGDDAGTFEKRITV